MKSTELEKTLTTLAALIREAAVDLNKAKDSEQSLEDETQDLLHTIELDPDSLTSVDIVPLLHDIRWRRRDAKMELEVSKIWADYVQQNKAALDKLPDAIGKMRKVLNRQALDVYRYKTAVLGRRDEFLARKDPEPEYVQLTLVGWEEKKEKEKEKKR